MNLNHADDEEDVQLLMEFRQTYEDQWKEFLRSKGLELYLVVVDSGTPIERTVMGIVELKEYLTIVADEAKKEHPYFDVTVYNDKDEDITESELITEKHKLSHRTKFGAYVCTCSRYFADDEAVQFQQHCDVENKK